MTLPQAKELFDYWRVWPPEHEMLNIMARRQGWRPEGNRPTTPEEHRASLEARWAAGALSPKQMMELMGGKLTMGTTPDPAPATQTSDPAVMPGIGRFPGAPPVGQ